MPPTDTAELRRLHEAATDPHDGLPGDSVALRNFYFASYRMFPALLDELEALREEVRRLQADNAKLAWAWDEVQSDTPKEAQDKARIIQAAVVCLNSLAWLDARDRRMKAIGAAEELEKIAKDEWQVASDGGNPILIVGRLQQRAAQLRREAEGK